MAQLLKKILISTSIAAGMGLAISAPASAAGITGASLDGTTSDYILYCLDGNETYNCTSEAGKTLQSVLDDGGAGNIELDADSETGTWGPAVSFSGTLNDGKAITISSLTQDDWTDDLGKKWLGEAITALVNQNSALNAYKTAINAKLDDIWTGLKAADAMAAFSDPNISSVSQAGNDASGNISIGLIGHQNAFDNPIYKNTFVGGLVDALGLNATQATQLSAGVTTLHASEVVKVLYNDTVEYKWSFDAPTATNVTERSDGFSHSGEYVVTINGMEMEPPASTPEPSAMIGMAALVGLYAGKRKLQKNA